jgi:hypothetical protein
MSNTYSFLDIFGTISITTNNNEDKEYKLDGVSVPMIQRDYVQGKESNKETRDSFLSDIFDVLAEKEKSLELDFIYGSIQKQTYGGNTVKRFVPLDGQQRLTTLYLLYWYIGRKELSKEELSNLNEKLSNFLYETRISSNNFCEWLSEFNFSFLKKPQTEITESSGFFRSYRQDPTVIAMLEMLDAIHAKYQSYSNEIRGKFYSNLKNIRFHLLPLDDFELSDELYIKMNARGKPLTNFEKFKADLVSYMEGNQKESKPSDSGIDDYNINVKYENIDMDWKTVFSIKLDTVWTNFFWKYCQKKTDSEERVVDPWFLLFFRRHFFNVYSIHSNISANALADDEVFKELYGKSGDDRKVSYQYFKSFQSVVILPNTLKNVDKILTCLDLYYESDIKPQMQLPWSDSKDWNFFENGQNGITQLQRVLLLGLTLFIEKIDFKPVDNNIFKQPCFPRWMRIVRNLAENAKINTIDSMIGVMRRVNEFSNSLNKAKDNDILNFLITNPDTTGTIKEQLQEEIEKAKQITNDKTNSWEKKIIEAENYAFFSGAIRFLFTDKDGAYNWNLFNYRFKKSNVYFNDKGIQEDYKKGALLLRVLISGFTTWDHFSSLTYDNTVSSWRSVLTSKKYLDPLSKLFGFENLLNFDFKMESHLNAELKQFHEDLYKTSLLSKIENITTECLFHSTYYGHYALYPRYARSQNYKFILADNRNQILSDLIDKGLLETKQRIDGLPYFKGREIWFTSKFNNKKYYWWDHLKVQNEKDEWIKVEEVKKLEQLEEFLLKSKS